MVPKYVVLKHQTLVYNVILVVISIYLHSLCTKCQIMYKRILKKGNIEQKGISKMRNVTTFDTLKFKSRIL